MCLTTPNPSSVPPSPSAYNHHHSFLYFPFSNFSWPLQPAQLPPTDGQPLHIYPDATYHHFRPPSHPRLPSTIWSQPPFSVSAIVSTLIVLHKFTLTSIFKSFQTLDNFPKTSQLNHSPKFIHSAGPNLSDNQPIVVQDTYRSAMPVARLGKSDVGLYSWPLLVWWWYHRCALIQTQHKDTIRQAVFSTNNNQETTRRKQTNIVLHVPKDMKYLISHIKNKLV